MGSFSNLRYSNTSKGVLATFSSENPIFECHLRINSVKKIKLVEVAKESKTMRIIRFQTSEEKPLLSAILVGDSGLSHW